MEQFGNIEDFNNLSEFNTNNHIRKQTRDSLLIGDISLQYSNAVSIIDGEMQVNSFTLKSEITENLFLANSNLKGDCEFKTILLPGWSYSNYQLNIALSGFSNDSGFIHSNDEAFAYKVKDNSFIIDESILNLQNRQSFNYIASNGYGYEKGFYVSNSNLYDDDDESTYNVRQNLELGAMARRNTNTVEIDNLSITSNVDVSQFVEAGTFLFCDHAQDIGGKRFEFPKLLNTLSNDDLNLTSSATVWKSFSNMSYILNSNAKYNKEFIKDNSEFIKESLSDNSIVTKPNNLKSMSTNQPQVKSNLNIGSISTQDSNDCSFQDINVVSMTSTLNPNSVFFDNSISDFDEFMAKRNPGFISLPSVVPYEQAMNEYNQFIDSNNKCRTEIKTDFDDFSNDLFKSNDSLSNILSPLHARMNMNLHEFAKSGNLTSLKSRPLFLSEFINDTNYVSKYKDLNDLQSVSTTLHNLGISNMAFENTDFGGNDSIAFNEYGDKMNQSNCVLDYIVVNAGQLYFRNQIFGEKLFDFLCVTGSKNEVGNYGYKFSRVEKCDSLYFADSLGFYNDPFRHVRVKLNDLSSFDDFTFPPDKETIVSDFYVPTAKFAYIKILELTENILHKFGLVFAEHTGNELADGLTRVITAKPSESESESTQQESF